jgi:hypothetical protein
VNAAGDFDAQSDAAQRYALAAGDPGVNLTQIIGAYYSGPSVLFVAPPTIFKG